MPERHAFLLLPGFSIVAFGGAVDTLHEINRQLPVPRYETLLLSVDGAAVASSSGFSVPVDGSIHALGQCDGVFVVADTPLPQRSFELALGGLHHFSQQARVMGGIGTGAYLLARTGLLDGYRATIHWPYTALLAEDFPDVLVSIKLFEIDRLRLTCGGGTASIDMMLYWQREHLGKDRLAALVDHIGLERLRGCDERQRVPLAARIGGGQPKLTEAVALMEANYEEPLPTEEIARLVGVSRRQLERLFKQHLDSLPSRYYLELRLNRARRLLQQTSHSILQIGLSCGFSSAPHFSSAYRGHFGITPREQRSRRAAAADTADASQGRIDESLSSRGGLESSINPPDFDPTC